MNKNVTALILVILAAGIYMTVTQDVFGQAKTIKEVNGQYVSAITNAEALIKIRDSIRKSFNNISQSDRERLDKMIPSTVDNIRLIIDLNNIALRHGMVFKGIRASLGTEAKAAKPVKSGQLFGGAAANNAANNIAAPVLDTVTVGFGVTASYEQFKRLLQDLEADLRIMDVTRLSMTASETGTYDWQLEFKTYWFRTQ